MKTNFVSTCIHDSWFMIDFIWFCCLPVYFPYFFLSLSLSLKFFFLPSQHRIAHDLMPNKLTFCWNCSTKQQKFYSKMCVCFYIGNRFAWVFVEKINFTLDLSLSLSRLNKMRNKSIKSPVMRAYVSKWKYHQQIWTHKFHSIRGSFIPSIWNS